MEKIITLVGGGLAGLACALGLRQQGLPVELHEAGTYPRHRVCGEFLCGVTPATLSALGLEPCLKEAIPLQTMAWFYRDRQLLRQSLPRPALGISRHRLDYRMSQTLENAGGKIHTHSRLPLQDQEGLLFCTGRPPSPGGWIGFKAHFTHLPLVADLEMHLGHQSYLGLSRIEDSTINVCGLFPAQALKNAPRHEWWPHLLQAAGLPALQSRLTAAHLLPESISAIAAFRPGWTRPPRLAPDDNQFVAHIGDAAVAIPPFTGNGMSMALESAQLAVQCLLPYARNQAPWSSALAALRTRTKQTFARRMNFALAMHPFLLHPLGQLTLAWTARSGLLPWKWAFLQTR